METPSAPTHEPNETTPPLDARLESLKKNSFIFGILSLVTFAWLAPVGLGFGIATLVLTTKARRRSRELNEQPPRTFGPQMALGLIGTIGGAIVTVIFTVALIVGLSTIIGASLKSNGGSYSDRIATLDAAQKSFSVNEVVAFGPFDLQFKDVQRSYTPTTEERAALSPYLAELQSEDASLQERLATNDAAVYTKFTVDLTYNAKRGAVYDGISTDVTGWGDALGDLELDGARCLVVTPGARELERYDASYKDGYTIGESITYICPGNTATPEKAEMTISYFKKVSFIVGTEGMPRGRTTYSVQF